MRFSQLREGIYYVSGASQGLESASERVVVIIDLVVCGARANGCYNIATVGRKIGKKDRYNYSIIIPTILNV